MVFFVTLILNLFGTITLFGFVSIICGKSKKSKSSKVKLVQQTHDISQKPPAPDPKPQPISDVGEKKKPPPPPPNVPVAKAKRNDHTMRNVESIKLEGSKE